MRFENYKCDTMPHSIALEPHLYATETSDYVCNPEQKEGELEMKLIEYVRVSTARQGESGLGLEAQQSAIAAYAAAHGGEVVASYREVESGRVNARPELAKALAHAKRTKAKLVIAKLDRLARNVAFVSTVMESSVEFVACDNPHASRLTLHILAAVAEHEAQMISERTRAALQAAKQRGVKLGSPIAAETLSKAREKRSERAKQRLSNVAAIVREIEQTGVTSLAGIARALTLRGVPTPRGGEVWQAVQVARIKAA